MDDRNDVLQGQKDKRGTTVETMFIKQKNHHAKALGRLTEHYQWSWKLGAGITTILLS